jgi:beta-lactamase class A
MKRAHAVVLLGAASLAFPRGAAAAAETLTWYASRLDGRGPVLAARQDLVLPAASVIKLLIAHTLVDESVRGRLGLDGTVRLNAGDRVDGSDRFGSAAPGAYRVRALLAAMLSLSDNTAANALLHHLGFARCNAQAVRMGLRFTLIRRSFDDWAAQGRGFENTTTARESAFLLQALRQRATTGAPGSAVAAAAMRALLDQTDRETIPPALLRRGRVANKTGELPDVRDDVAIVRYDAPDAYVIAVMSRYGGAARATVVAEIRSVMTRADRAITSA